MTTLGKAAARVGLGLAATLALSAQAQSQVNLYGVVDVYAGHATGAGGSWTRMRSGGHADSRIGFRGREDLGGGHSARFALESAVNPETGSGANGLGFARQARVGLAGPWGALDLGRMYTPMFQAMAKAEPYVLNTVFSPMNLGAATFTVPASPTAQRPFAPRSNSMVRYRTPSSPDWHGELAYAFADQGASHRSGEMHGGALAWTRAPLYVAYAFQQLRTAATAAAAAAGSPRVVKTRYQSLSIQYRVNAAFHVFAIVTHTTASNPALRDARLLSTGVTWRPTPQGTFTASVAQRKASGVSGSRLAWTLGYDHALSRRTTVYARWLGVGDHGQTEAANTTMPASRLLALGLRHNF